MREDEGGLFVLLFLFLFFFLVGRREGSSGPEPSRAELIFRKPL